MTVKEYVAQKAAEAETRAKEKAAKDQLTATDIQTREIDEEKKLHADFWKALASIDVAEVRKVNERVVKQYEAKGIEWRNEKELKQKAQTVGTSSQGGALVPVSLAQSIMKRQQYYAPMRTIATVMSDIPPALDMPFETALPTTAWTAEGAAITESGSTFNKKQLIPYKLAGLDKFTSEALMDVATYPDIGSFVEDRFGLALAIAESVAFVGGDGSGKPFGFRSSDITPNNSLSQAGAAGALAFTDLTNLFVNGLPTAYRMLGTFITSSKGLQLVWNIKDSNNRPIYLPDLTGQTPGTLFGRPMVVADEIPTNLGAGTNETELWYCVPKNYIIGNRGGYRVEWGTDADDFSKDKMSLRVIERVAGRPFMDLSWSKMNIK